VISHKDLIGGEYHVFELPDRVDGFYLQPGLLQRTTQVLPLMLRPDAIDRQAHVRVLRFAHIEKRRRAE
jgi:hypothetical protein